MQQQSIAPWSIYDREFRPKMKRAQNASPFRHLYSPFPRQLPISHRSGHQKVQSFYAYSSTKTIQDDINRLLALKVIRTHLATENEERGCLYLPKLQTHLAIKKHSSNRSDHSKEKYTLKLRANQRSQREINVSQDKHIPQAFIFDYDPFCDSKISQRKHAKHQPNLSKFKFQSVIQFEMIKY